MNTEQTEQKRAATVAHTAEPWRAVQRSKTTGSGIDPYAVLDEMDGPVALTIGTEANARRIAACVNACAGLALPDGVPVGALAQAVAALRSAEGMLFAESTVQRIGAGGRIDREVWALTLSEARAAIAAAEGVTK